MQAVRAQQSQLSPAEQEKLDEKRVEREAAREAKDKEEERLRKKAQAAKGAEAAALDLNPSFLDEEQLVVDLVRDDDDDDDDGDDSATFLPFLPFSSLSFPFSFPLAASPPLHFCHPSACVSSSPSTRSHLHLL